MDISDNESWLDSNEDLINDYTEVLDLFDDVSYNTAVEGLHCGNERKYLLLFFKECGFNKEDVILIERKLREEQCVL